MSNDPDCIMGGISITWKIENFSSIPNKWDTSVPLDWVTTKSKWDIGVFFRTSTKQSSIKANNKGIYLRFGKSGDIAPLRLIGTVFAVNGNSKFKLSNIDWIDFKMRSWCTDIIEIDWEKEGLIHKDCLTLRINLSDPNINELVAVEYYIRSTCVQQICSFQWSIKGFRCWRKDGEYYVSSTEVPMEFLDFHTLQGFRMKIKLQVIDRNIFPIIEATEVNQKSFFIQGSYKIEIQREEGTNLHQLNEEWEQYHFNSYMGDRMRYTDGIGSFVDSECVVKIEILLVTNSRGIMERNCFESNLQKLSRKLGMLKEKLLSKNNLQNSMQTLYEQGKFCDVILQTEKETFPCHKAVLCARSSVFQTMFENDMLEKKTNVVTIDDIESKMLRVFLNYLYSDKLGDVDFDSLMKLYAVADKYDILTLQEICADKIVSFLSTDNVCEVLDLADSHQDEGLKKEVLSYFCDHSKEIVGSSHWKTLFVSKPSLAAETLQTVLSNIS